MLLIVVIFFLLIGNWFLTESLILIPVDWAIRLSHLGGWALALLALSFVAWCMGDD